ncbi:unnamed protein product [Sphenostylis stenocarpa]|uniref:Uncharacterized protein n=1 Tax=Sphenostylis stenocarpa TaxID=92480 RepID=A0AA86W5U9_9FABA|nr:unnamed protein product [Sphenostylis stenocarpa]
MDIMITCHCVLYTLLPLCSVWEGEKQMESFQFVCNILCYDEGSICLKDVVEVHIDFHANIGGKEELIWFSSFYYFSPSNLQFIYCNTEYKDRDRDIQLATFCSIQTIW